MHRTMRFMIKGVFNPPVCMVGCSSLLCWFNSTVSMVLLSFFFAAKIHEIFYFIEAGTRVPSSSRFFIGKDIH